MKITICNTYHKDHQKQAFIVNSHYIEMGYEVDSFEADFKEVSEADCRNAFFNRNPDSDYIIYLDSDEILLEQDMQYLLKQIEETQKDAYRCSIIDYVGRDEVLLHPRVHKPIVAVVNRVKWEKAIKFKYNRNVSKCDSYDEVPIAIHHLGYMINPEWKLKNYRERNEFHELGNVEAIINQTRIKCKTPNEIINIMDGLGNLLDEIPSSFGKR